MKEKFKNKKVEEIVDLLVEGGADLSKSLEKCGSVASVYKSYFY